MANVVRARLCDRLADGKRNPSARSGAASIGQGGAYGWTLGHTQEWRGPIVSVHGRHGDHPQGANFFAIHETLKSGRVVPFVFHRNGKRIKYLRAAWEDACTEAGYPNALVHDMRRFRRSRPDVRACRCAQGRPRCRWWATRRRASIGATQSSMRPCSGKPPRVWTRSQPSLNPGTPPASSRGSLQRSPRNSVARGPHRVALRERRAEPSPSQTLSDWRAFVPTAVPQHRSETIGRQGAGTPREAGLQLRPFATTTRRDSDCRCPSAG